VLRSVADSWTQWNSASWLSQTDKIILLAVYGMTSKHFVNIDINRRFDHNPILKKIFQIML
jgi:hypothetical protein